MGNNMVSEISRSYNSFSGSDIRAQIGPYPFAEIQAISYSITREKAPIYTMGSPDPRSFSRNKRGIAGSLVWINFDRHALLNLIIKSGGTFVANKDDIKAEYLTKGDDYLNQTAVYNTSVTRIGSGMPPVGATINELDVPRAGNDSTSGFKQEATPFYSDQILPFDVTLSGVNEMGAATAMKIFGVEILNEGYGVSIDDSVSEMQATWVARAVEPWQAVANNFKQTGSGNR
jgi:hypothetical protein